MMCIHVSTESIEHTCRVRPWRGAKQCYVCVSRDARTIISNCFRRKKNGVDVDLWIETRVSLCIFVLFFFSTDDNKNKNETTRTTSRDIKRGDNGLTRA